MRCSGISTNFHLVRSLFVEISKSVLYKSCSASQALQFLSEILNCNHFFVAGRRRLTGVFHHKSSPPWTLLVLVVSTLISIAGESLFSIYSLTSETWYIVDIYFKKFEQKN